MKHNNLHTPHAGISGAIAAPKTASKTAPVNGQTANDIPADLKFAEIFGLARQAVLKAKSYAKWRAETKAGIKVIKTIEEATPGIGPKNRAIPTYGAMVDLASNTYLRSEISRIQMLEADADAMQEIAAAAVKTLVSYFREIKANGQSVKESREGEEVTAIIAALRKQFCCSIERAIREAEAELRDLRQLLVCIAACPNDDEREAMRETAVRKFLVTISRAKSEADAALGDFEAARNSAAGMVKIAQLHAVSAVEELPALPTGYYTPKDLARYLGTGENNIRGRLSEIVKNGRLSKGDLKCGGRWEIDNSIVNRVYKILKRKR